MANGGTGDGDPFEDLVLDDEFIKGAARRELTASDRLGAARRAEEARQRAVWQQRRERRRRRLHRPAWAAARRVNTKRATVLVVILVLIAWTMSSGPLSRNEGLLVSGPPIMAEVVAGERPTPRRPDSETPLLPQARATAASSYAFMATQDGSDAPVTYDPCRIIPVVFNSRTAPAQGSRLVGEALERISMAAGLQFHLEASTAEVPSPDRRAFQPDRYGDRWAPVLVAWSDPGESPELTGGVIGTGGSTPRRVTNGSLVYVSGVVILDGPQLGDLLGHPNGYARARAVILHELGHVVGLDHVDDPRQLMHARGAKETTTFGAGDLSGIARLRSSDRCVPRL